MQALTRRTAAAGVAGVLVLTGATACGSSKKSSSGTTTTSGTTKSKAAADPQKTFTDAVAKLGATKGGTVTLKVAATEAEINAFATASDKADGKTPDPDNAKIAHYLATGTVVIKTVGKSVSFDVNLEGKPIVQFAGSEASDVYFRADVPGIAKLAGPSAQAEVNQVSGQLPAGFEFVKDAVAGKWLEVDAASLKQIEALAQSRIGAATATPDPAQAKAFEAKLAAALGADFTATDAGSDPKGEHLVLTGNLKKLVADVFTAAQDLPGASAAFTKIDTADVPDKDVKVDAYVGDKGLTALDLNVAQFADDPTVAAMSFPLEVAFTDAPSSIDLPSSSTKVDLSKLLGSLGSLGLGKG